MFCAGVCLGSHTIRAWGAVSLQTICIASQWGVGTVCDHSKLWPTRLGVALALGHFHSRAGLLKVAVFDTLAQWKMDSTWSIAFSVLLTVANTLCPPSGSDILFVVHAEQAACLTALVHGSWGSFSMLRQNNWWKSQLIQIKGLSFCKQN